MLLLKLVKAVIGMVHSGSAGPVVEVPGLNSARPCVEFPGHCTPPSCPPEGPVTQKELLPNSVKFKGVVVGLSGCTRHHIVVI